MSRKARVFSLLIVIVASAGAGVGWWLMAGPLPHPNSANRVELMRWLVSRDLSAEQRDIQESLVDRLEEEFGAADAPAAGRTVPERYRDRLSKNLALMEEVWFETRVTRYAGCTVDQRMEFLESQISAISVWSAAATQAVSGSASTGAIPVEFFSRIDGWIAAADDTTRPIMSSALRDAVVCWLATRDAAELSQDAQTTLANRIAQSLGKGTSTDDVQLPLEQAHRAKLAENGRVLLKAWLLEQAQVLEPLPPAERTPFVDDRINEVMEWNILPLITFDGTESPATAMATGLRLLELIDGWTASAPESNRAAMQSLTKLVKQRLFWRQMNRASSKEAD